jgi:hypothetical protein
VRLGSLPKSRHLTGLPHFTPVRGYQRSSVMDHAGDSTHANGNAGRGTDGRFLKGYRASVATEFQLGTALNWRPHRPFREKAYLLEEYVNKGRSAGRIAADHGVTEGTIYFWLRKHGISCRSTSEAIREAKKYGNWGAGTGPGNPMYGKVGSLNPNWKGGVTPERQAFYASAEWKAVAKRVKRRDHWTCQRCGATRGDGLKLAIHHVIPFGVVRLRLDPANLVLLCQACHDFVHSRRNVRKEFIGSVGGSQRV